MEKHYNISRNAMKKIQSIAKKSGLTQQVIGEKMGYPVKSARQSVSQFLKTKNPTFDVVIRFTKAMNIRIEDLL